MTRQAQSNGGQPELALMTRHDRDDLARVAKLRAKVAKSTVAQRQAELLADVEAKLSAVYGRDDAAWADVTAVAQEAVSKADAIVAQRCRELGIPEEFRPGLALQWYRRGENAVSERRQELRKKAQTAIAASAQAAKLAIETRESEVLTELVAGGLETEQAKAFLESIPTAAALMPAMTVAELEA